MSDIWIQLSEEEQDRICVELPDIEQRIIEARKSTRHSSPRAMEFFAKAKEQQTDDLEIDDDAIVSIGEEGAFVLSWLFIFNSEIESEESDDDASETDAVGTQI